MRNQQGLAILTVIKAGFLGSARFGSGLVVARLPDGSWSAPTAIMTGGAGFGGQIGFELTDFVFILNDANAVKTFAQSGSITLGGNVSIAAGPVGRNAEAAGAASLKSVAGIFSYSKTKGLFAGVSLEGSAIIERKDANERLYGQRLTAAQLLSGAIKPPAEAASLLTILNDRRFLGIGSQGNAYSDDYNDGSHHDDHHQQQQQNSGFGAPSRANTWQDDVYDRPSAGINRSNTAGVGDNYNYRDRPSSTGGGFPDEKKNGPGRPAAPKPNFASKQAMLKKNEAVALFTFEADQPGDLSFKKGDVITVLKKTDNETDWWYVNVTCSLACGLY
jgi:lipid-binding SYLF domain-containing protein